MDRDLHDLDIQHAVVVVDASESADELWTPIVQIADALCDIASDLYVLGCDVPLEPQELDESSAGLPHDRARRCGLIAPIMERFLRQCRTVDALIIVGNGEVWDLGDWADCSLIRQWLLVRVGPDSLQPPGLGLPEYPSDQLEAALLRLGGSREDARPATAETVSFWSSMRHSWRVDRAGFPLIYVEPVRAYVHLFPVAKAQFEHFLWQQNDAEWGDERYAQLLECNPRASPADLALTMHERLFLTGIIPEEVSQFARWLGRGFAPLAPEEWRATRAWLGRQDATAAPSELIAMGLARFAADMWHALLAELEPDSMLELSLVEGGVIEWVYDSAAARPRQHVGMGCPRSSFFATVKSVDKPLVPIDPARRMRHFGFRLKRRP